MCWILATIAGMLTTGNTADVLTTGNNSWLLATVAGMLTTGNSSRHADYWQHSRQADYWQQQQTTFYVDLLEWPERSTVQHEFTHSRAGQYSGPLSWQTCLQMYQLKYIICLLLFIFTRLCLLLIMLCPHGCGWDFYLWLRALWFTLALLSAWNFGVSWFWQFFRNKKTNKKHHLVFKTTTHPQPQAPPFLCVCVLFKASTCLD